MPAPGAHAAHATKSVLIVDDEEEIGHLLKRAFERSRPDVHVHLAQSPEAAIRLLEDTPVSLVITDFKMPGQNGLDLLRWVRQHRPEAARVLMTGHAETSMAIDAANEGKVARFILKPFALQDMIDLMSDVLDLERAKAMRNAAFDHAIRVLEARSPRQAPAGADLSE